MRLLNLNDAPRDPFERIMWLTGVMKQAKKELDAAFAEAYYDLRLEGRLLDAIAMHVHSRNTILRWTRNENRRRGQAVRWRDGLDPTSTAYDG